MPLPQRSRAYLRPRPGRRDTRRRDNSRAGGHRGLHGPRSHSQRQVHLVPGLVGTWLHHLRNDRRQGRPRVWGARGGGLEVGGSRCGARGGGLEVGGSRCGARGGAESGGFEAGGSMWGLEVGGSRRGARGGGLEVGGSRRGARGGGGLRRRIQQPSAPFAYFGDRRSDFLSVNFLLVKLTFDPRLPECPQAPFRARKEKVKRDEVERRVKDDHETYSDKFSDSAIDLCRQVKSSHCHISLTLLH